MRNCIVCGHLFAEQEHGAAQLRLQSLQNKMEKTERVLDSFCFFYAGRWICQLQCIIIRVILCIINEISFI